MDRAGTMDRTVQERTRALIDRVRLEGDEALRDFARTFDGVSLEALEVPRAAWDASLTALDPALRAALERSVRNISAVHAAFRPTETVCSPEPGITVGRRPDPLARVGIYAPGGRAAYPSSLLMGAIPARVAGVGDVIVCSPPGPDGLPSPVVLAAAALAGVDRVYALGGAGAIAAMALGTASVPRVDRIMGPGNAYVAEAKRQLVGEVAIDSPAGPSELLVIADDSADPEVLARELVAQAEHDPDAAVMALLITDEDRLLTALEQALSARVSATPRREIVSASLAARGALCTVPTVDEAIAFANAWAAEHLLLVVHDQDRERMLAQLRGAGTIFVGASSSVAYGDYMTGANHVLPTGGAGRSYSGLSTLDFVRWTTWQEVTPAAAARLAVDVGTFADAEGLPAHAAAARAWGAHDVAPDAIGRRPSLVRPAIEAMPLYDPKRAPVALDLTDNTNLWGLPPSAERVLRALPPARVTRYPSLYAAELKRALAGYAGTTAEHLVTGCGSDDLLDNAMRAFGEPGSVVAASVPTFAMIPIFAQGNALRYVGITERPDHQPDLEALLAARPRLLYLCTPNNPTGVRMAHDLIERAAREAPGVVIVDEAYAEFAGESAVALTSRYDNLLVIRTLSKAVGLAGLRVGYAVGAPPLVQAVEKARGPYKVNAVAEEAATAALTEDREWIATHVQLAIEARDRLTEALRDRGFSPLPSSANFVCVPMADAVAVGHALRAQGVAARPFTGLPHVGDALRISVGPWPLLEEFLAAFDSVRNTQGGRA
jgi:histidinol dehydrogenase